MNHWLLILNCTSSQPRRPSVWPGRIIRAAILTLIACSLLSWLNGCASKPATVERSPAVMMEDVQAGIGEAVVLLQQAEPQISEPELKLLVGQATAKLEVVAGKAGEAATASAKRDEKHDKEVKALEKKVDGLSDPIVKMLNFAAGALAIGGIVAAVASIWYGGAVVRRLGLLALVAGLLIGTLASIYPVIEWIVIAVAILALAFAAWRWRAVYAAASNVVRSIDAGRVAGVVEIRPGARTVLDPIQGTEGKALVDSAQAKKRRVT